MAIVVLYPNSIAYPTVPPISPTLNNLSASGNEESQKEHATNPLSYPKVEYLALEVSRTQTLSDMVKSQRDRDPKVDIT